MTEEEKIFAGKLFFPGNPALKAIKLKAHNLDTDYNATHEDETEKRTKILKNLIGSLGDHCFFQGPIFFHYGTHTSIGDSCFFNFNLTIQDDASVTIGKRCNFGPNVTIVTPIHPMIAQERRGMTDAEGETHGLCCAKPVTIGDDCWLGANVVVCPGVKIGSGVVVGAGSVVTRDLPDNVFAAGNPCRVIREITQADSLKDVPDLW